MSLHPFDTELALYAGGDLRGWERIKTALHVRSCESCKANVEAFRTDLNELHQSAEEMPAGVNWDRLAGEMTANIRVGLAAGECVAPPRAAEFESSFWNWKPLAAGAGLAVVFASAWWLNMPAVNFVGPDERGPVVEASARGIEYRENGSALGVGSGDAQPVATSVSFDGSASARFVDDSTGQVTIATVYGQ